MGTISCEPLDALDAISLAETATLSRLRGRRLKGLAQPACHPGGGPARSGPAWPWKQNHGNREPEMPYRSFLILSVLLLSGCTASSVVDPLVEAGKVRTPPTQPFRPGVPGRDAWRFCNSTTTECKHWTALAIQCDDHMDWVRRNSGQEFLLALFSLRDLLGDPCKRAEKYRRQVTGVYEEDAPGSHLF